MLHEAVHSHRLVSLFLRNIDLFTASASTTTATATTTSTVSNLCGKNYRGNSPLMRSIISLNHQVMRNEQFLQSPFCSIDDDVDARGLNALHWICHSAPSRLGRSKPTPTIPQFFPNQEKKEGEDIDIDMPDSCSSLKKLLSSTTLDINSSEPHYGYTPMFLAIEHLITKTGKRGGAGAGADTSVVKTIKQVSPSLCLCLCFSFSLRGYFSILMASCFMWSGVLDSSGVLQSYSIIPLAYHITTILIFDIYLLLNI